MEVGGELYAPAALSLGKSPRYPFARRLGGPQSRSGHSGGGPTSSLGEVAKTKIHSLFLPGIESRSSSP
jgi:hypothetical protein